MRNIGLEKNRRLWLLFTRPLAFSVFFVLFRPLHIQYQTERAGDILKTDVCFVTYFCVYIALRLCRTRLQCGWIGALCSRVPWQVYSSTTLSCTAADMSTRLWPFVLDLRLFLLPCVCSISAEIMCGVVLFCFACSVWFSCLVPLAVETVTPLRNWNWHHPFGFGLWLKYVRLQAKN